MRVRSETGRSESMSMQGAIVLKLFQVAMAGSPMAIKTLMTMLSDAQRTNERERRKHAEEWREIRKKLRIEFERRLKSGEETDSIIPHPDDIVIEADDTVRIVGPLSEEEASKVRETIAVRDLLFLQDEYESRPGVLKWDPDLPATDNKSSALLISWTMNISLPPRLRLSEHDMLLRMWIRRPFYTKRQLETLLYQRWRALGVRAKRGATLPLFGTMRDLYLGLQELVGRSSEAARNGSPMTDLHIFNEIVQLYRRTGMNVKA
ncbi:hypothetical protein GC173_18470 [bacterium]|nr:hypothetical protein [bacterium]